MALPLCSKDDEKKMRFYFPQKKAKQKLGL